MKPDCTLKKKKVEAFFDEVIISPTSGEELKCNDLIYECAKKKEEYPIIGGIPVIIDKNDISEYFKSTYKANFKYYRYWDLAFLKNLKRKLKLKSNSLLLDIGGGNGFYSNCFRDLKMNTITLDFSKYMLEKGKEKYPFLDFIAADANKIPFKENTFDVVFCSGLSSFNTNELSKCSILIDHIMSKLKTGGVLIFIHSSNLTGALNKNWYNITKDDLDRLFGNYKIINKWFIPRPFVANILNQFSFTSISSDIFSFIIKNTYFINKKIRGRVIYIIKK